MDHDETTRPLTPPQINKGKRPDVLQWNCRSLKHSAVQLTFFFQNTLGKGNGIVTPRNKRHNPQPQRICRLLQPNYNLETSSSEQTRQHTTRRRSTDGGGSSDSLCMPGRSPHQDRHTALLFADPRSCGHPMPNGQYKNDLRIILCETRHAMLLRRNETLSRL